MIEPDGNTNIAGYRKLKNDKKDLYLGQGTYVIIREGEWNNARNGTSRLFRNIRENV